MGKGDVASARRYAEACLRVEQDHPMIRVILGRALVQQGRTDAGVVEINRALQEAADSPGVRRHAALAFAAMKDAARTRESWEALERLSPNNLDARLAILAMDEGGR